MASVSLYTPPSPCVLFAELASSSAIVKFRVTLHRTRAQLRVQYLSMLNLFSIYTDCLLSRLGEDEISRNTRHTAGKSDKIMFKTSFISREKSGQKLPRLSFIVNPTQVPIIIHSLSPRYYKSRLRMCVISH